MSATHSPALPVMALQLAVLAEKYRRAVEAGNPEAASAQLREGARLAQALAPLWAEWGQLMVAHNDLIQQRLHGAPASLTQKALKRAAGTAHLFVGHCLHWALFEQARPSVPFHTADAFIAWEGARRSAWQLREQIDQFLADSNAPDVPKPLADIAAQAERNADRLLVQAVTFLEGDENPAPCPTD
jgi:hypothetical protein